MRSIRGMYPLYTLWQIIEGLCELTDRTIKIEECKDGKLQKFDIKFELSEVGSYKISIIE